MATRKLTVATVLEAARKVLFVWSNHSTFSVQAFTKADVEASVTKVEALEAEITELQLRLSGLVDERNNELSKLNQFITRLKSAIRGVFGPDSVEYGQAGGTRTSEIKR